MADDSKKDIKLDFSDNPDEMLEKTGLSPLENIVSQNIVNNSGLQKSEFPLQKVINQATGTAKRKAPSLAFAEHPQPSSNYLGLFKSKQRLLPDELIKNVRVIDHLVAAIVRARSNMMRLYGHLRKDRFDIGLEIEIKPEFLKVLTPEQYEELAKRVKRLEQILLNCGHTEGLEQQDRMTLSDFLAIQTGNGVSFGRHGTEIIYERSGATPVFHRFRPVDIGTIYKAVRKGEQVGNNLRELALKALEALDGEKVNVDIRKLKEDRFAWLQVIEGTPRQAFTHEELLVHNLFPSTDVEHNGYPVSPLDTVVNSVTTHISIDSYIKLFFQNGKASRGMLVIKSDEVDQQMLDAIKMQFNASINSVSNSFRTPIFGISTSDDVQWVSTNDRAGDGDFQYTYDQVARNILAAFGVSPDEIPGYGHLSKGTNSQTLSESNNEFKLVAARDSGLRPLILGWQTFLNVRLLPIIDAELAQLVEIKLCGLDSQSKDQESARLQQDSALFHNYDSLMNEVDLDGVGEAFGGKVPFNERYRQVLDFYMEVGLIKSKFFGDPSAIFDPTLKFKRDPFHLQHLQLLMQVNPNAVKALYASKNGELIKDLLEMQVQDMLDSEEDGI